MIAPRRFVAFVRELLALMRCRRRKVMYPTTRLAEIFRGTAR